MDGAVRTLSDLVEDLTNEPVQDARRFRNAIDDLARVANTLERFETPRDKLEELNRMADSTHFLAAKIPTPAQVFPLGVEQIELEDCPTTDDAGHSGPTDEELRELAVYLKTLPRAFALLAKWSEAESPKMHLPKSGRPKGAWWPEMLCILHVWQAATGQATPGIVHDRVDEERRGPFVDFAQRCLELFCPDFPSGDPAQLIYRILRSLQREGPLDQKSGGKKRISYP